MTASPSDSPESTPPETPEEPVPDTPRVEATEDFSQPQTPTEGATAASAPAGSDEESVLPSGDAEPQADTDQAGTDQADTDQATTDGRPLVGPDAAEPDSSEPDSSGERNAESAKSKKAKKKPDKKKPSGPNPATIVKIVGATSEAALSYVQNPDPKLSRMARKHREAVITEIPPVTAGALLGPEALCRHFLASAASGRYQDLFYLWDLFVLYPDDCKTVLNARQKAQEKAKAKLRLATHMGLLGDAERVAADIDRAAGLPWRWMQDILKPMEPAISQRPAVLAAMARRDAAFSPQLPDNPSDRWLAEAAALKESGKDIPADMDRLLGQHADRLPATIATLSMAQQQYPDRVSSLIDRVDLDAPDIGSLMAWARDHGHAEQLVGRVTERVTASAAADRATGLAEWRRWQERGVQLDMPQSLTAPNLDGLDLGRPESAELIKQLIDGGADLDAQQILDDVAATNRMLGEKAFEAFVCAGFDTVHLPLVLEGNPMVRPETRCPSCQAWTWVRPGLEKRCPRNGCPLRQQSPPSAEDEGAAIDAAVAGLTVDPGSSTGVAEPTQGAPATDSADRPAVVEGSVPPLDRPGQPPPVDTEPELDTNWTASLGSEDTSASKDTSGGNNTSAVDEVTSDASS